MGSIRAIEGDAVHRIHAGQVVLELQQAVKELVENSLDSGATSIEVKIKDHGMDTVEVIDNGSGIAEEDWPSIGLKHHTSKLPTLADLPLVTTFGFRGEALSALCALCDTVTIVTATKETAPLGTIIKLGKSGKVLDSSGKVARPRGTTVTLSGLFVPLPVRRKEFERTAKREFTKALTTLTSYALVPASVSKEDGREGVRLKVESIASGKNGKRNALIVTDGRGSLRSSITSVWGPKALDNILDINLDLDVGIDKSMAKREGLENSSQNVKVSGLISSATWGQGRSSADRQFYYINGRPVDVPVVAKAVNEVYKSFNTHQLPVVVLDFTVPRESVDINVSPDKRSIFLHSEAQLVEALRAALDAFFQPSRSSFAVGGASQKVTLVQSSLLPRTRTGTEAITLDEDEEEEDEAQVCDAQDEDEEAAVSESQDTATSGLEESDKENVPLPDEMDAGSGSQTPSPTSTPPLSRRTRPPVKQSSSTSTPSRVVHTTSTKTASWSPDRTTRLTSTSRAPTKREARTTLRNRIQGYASQAGTSTGLGAKSRGRLPSDDELKSEEGEEEEEIVVVPAAGRRVVSRQESEVEEDSGDAESSAPARVAKDAQRASWTSGPPTSDVVAVSVDSVVDESGMIVDDNDDVNATDGSTLARRTSVRPPRSISDEAEESATVAELDTSLSSEEWLDRTDRHEFDAMDVDEDTDVPTAGPSRRRPRSPQPLDAEDFDDHPNPLSPADHQSSTSKRLKSSSSYRDEITSTAQSGEMKISFSIDNLRTRHRKRRKRHSTSSATTQGRDAFTLLKERGISSAAGIENKDLASAEEALSRVISKADFERMEVLGQFNKGFIIARLRRGPLASSSSPGKGKAQGKEDGKEGRELGTDDLFIVDQHASDEKYNFETLQRTTVIKAQTLIRPRPLQLTAGDEIVAVENLDILRSNGFEVEIDEDKPPGRGERISLSAMPVSKDTTFDFKDLEQLLHLLSDGSRPAGQMVRCTKARSMFASRACRKSVMIGKSLTRNQMINLLRNMGTIDQPWNCPHGRPTMRHLTKLELGKMGRTGTSHAIDWASWLPPSTD